MKDRSDTEVSTRASIEALFARHVNPGKVETYRQFGISLAMGERGGCRFRDAFDGDRRFFNCHSNGGVFNLGHRNPRVIAALQRALERFDIGNHHLVSEPRARLAAKLAASTDGVLSGVVFGVSGGEANDLALKLARAHTGRPTIVSALGGYHGHTGLSLATGDPQFRDPFGPNLPDFVQLPFNDRAALEAAIDDRTAAVILEPIPATLGMPLPESGYLAYAHELCRQRGALLILDEVQTGLGRTGSLWFYQQEGLTPDILTTGKGLSGGIYPLTATLMRPEIHRFFEAHPFIHVSTFGGAEVGCAVGEEVLAIASDPAFLARVRELAARFAEGFAGAPFELRQRGLFMGLKFAVPRGGMMACKLLYDAGIYTVYAGNDTSVLQFLPALVTDDDEADEIIRRVRKTLG